MTDYLDIGSVLDAIRASKQRGLIYGATDCAAVRSITRDGDKRGDSLQTRERHQLENEEVTAPINWPRLALMLRKHVGPLQTLSGKIGRHAGYLGQLARGEISEPGFSDGIRLLDFAHDHLPPDVFKTCKLGGGYGEEDRQPPRRLRGQGAV